ncbi:MerR family transcriptional regulator [Xanthobacter sp. AM11]|uniref:MerR family transcriptional regulator n=1 Tax=Xanthobacter sp. AM11 TaxID=3380643 RepID=UPI0039BEF585
MDAKTFEQDMGSVPAPGQPAYLEGAAEMPSVAGAVLTIGDLSREFGITLRALRFYEDKGLISPRRDGMTRLYSDADRRRLAVILKGKHLGFTLTEIRALVAAHDKADGAEAGLSLSRERCLAQLAQLERQRTEIDDAIAELKAMASTLAA